MIVDDVESLLFAQAAYFTKKGWQVDATTTGSEARELVREHSYDVVMCDLRLGDDDERGEGLDIVQLVRETLPLTRVVLHTAYASSELEKRRNELGIDRVITKPQPLAELARILESLRHPAA